MKKPISAIAVSLLLVQPAPLVYAHQDIHDAATRYRTKGDAYGAADDFMAKLPRVSASHS
jgi:hypothetical protein